MSPQQQLFADEYLIDSNGTQAAIRAGYTASGATVTAYKLLQKKPIADYIAKKRQTIADRLGIDAEFVLRHMKNIGEKTQPVASESNPSVSLKAFELLGKHLKLFEEDDKKQGNVTINLIQF